MDRNCGVTGDCELDGGKMLSDMEFREGRFVTVVEKVCSLGERGKPKVTKAS
jgi:hypothetical protein